MSENERIARQLEVELFGINLTNNPQKPANLFAPKCQRKRSRIKQIGWFLRVYPVQSVHAPHSEEVNAARASRLAG
jgi:hypothetical protein